MWVIAVMPPALPPSAFTSGFSGKTAANFPSGEESSVQSDCAGALLETHKRKGMTAAANQEERRMEVLFRLSRLGRPAESGRVISLVSFSPLEAYPNATTRANVRSKAYSAACSVGTPAIPFLLFPSCLRG